MLVHTYIALELEEVDEVVPVEVKEALPGTLKDPLQQSL